MDHPTGLEVKNKKITAPLLLALILLFMLAFFVFSVPPQGTTPDEKEGGLVPLIDASIMDVFSSGDYNASSTDPQVTVYGNSTYVVWQDNSTGNNEIYLKMSPAGKADFGRTFNLSRNDGSSTDPQVHCLWK